jgi:CRP-like cAMP-binding protein
MTTLKPLLQNHPFFADLAESDLELITGCTRNAVFQPGAVLAGEGMEAHEFFLIREGRVAVALPSPRGGRLTIETLDAGEVIGWSWLMPPHTWQFDIVAVTRVRALVMDGRCLRGKCDADPRLGYDLMRRFSNLMAGRLAATRLQLMDLYRYGDLKSQGQKSVS